MERRSLLPHSQEPSTSWISILTLSSLLRLTLSSYLFPSGFLTKTLYALLLVSKTCHMLSHFHCYSFWSPELYLVRSTVHKAPCYVVFSTPLLPRPSYTLLSTLFSKTLSLCFYLNVWDRFSHPYKTRAKTIFLYISIFIFLDNKVEDKNSAQNDKKHSLTLICFEYIRGLNFDCFKCLFCAVCSLPLRNFHHCLVTSLSLLFLAQARNIPSPKRPDQNWSPPSLLFMGTKDSSLCGRATGARSSPLTSICV